VQAIVEPAAGRAQRRVTIVGEGTAYGQTIGAGGLGRGIRARVELPFERAHAPHLFLELLLGMAIGFVDGLGRFAEVVELAPLMGNPRQGRTNGAANGVLAIGEHRLDGDRQRLLHFAQQGGQILLRRAQQTARQ
jgi:hypothetical protein